MAIFDDDIIKDILRRVISASQREGGFTESLAIQIEQQARHDWAGSEPYIRAGARDRIAERNEKIAAMYHQQGIKDLAVLRARTGLSVKQLRRILEI